MKNMKELNDALDKAFEMLDQFPDSDGTNPEYVGKGIDVYTNDDIFFFYQVNGDSYLWALESDDLPDRYATLAEVKEFCYSIANEITIIEFHFSELRNNGVKQFPGLVFSNCGSKYDYSAELYRNE